MNFRYIIRVKYLVLYELSNELVLHFNNNSLRAIFFCAYMRIIYSK